MLQSEQIELLDQLRFGERASDRNKALRELKLHEAEGLIAEEDLLRLLDEKDFVFKTYAIGAIGRLKLERAIPKLSKIYKESNDPMILPALLETFVGFESDAFVDCVAKKLKMLSDSKNKTGNGNLTFLLEQIVVPSLKYLQTSGTAKVEKTVNRFLDDPDPTIRWHALMTFDKLNLKISDQKLKQYIDEDSYALVREQASVMLEKRKKQK
ncbi:MAG: hypothetical protein MJE63_20075 [Proteobacteria bacterium]|nr:hypothetical protein [Pseudomonadota bacterium]